MTVQFPEKVETPEVYIGILAEAYMREVGFEIYREVSLGAGRQRADLVGRRGPVIWVVECKAALTLHGMAQCHAWRGRAHLISMACPKGRTAITDVMRASLNGMGYGWLQTSINDLSHGSVEEKLHPRFHRRVTFNWTRVLNEAQKDYCAAGVKSGGWTPFKATVAEVERIVIANPGITLKLLMTELKGKHHYPNDAAAIGGISHWIREGVIKNIKTINEKGKLRLFHQTQILL